MLPGIDGLEVCWRLRARSGDLSVVMLTALGEENDRVLGLKVGADDCLTKPFSPRELVLRVQSVLRRASSRPPDQRLAAGPLRDGDLEVDLAVSAGPTQMPHSAIPRHLASSPLRAQRPVDRRRLRHRCAGAADRRAAPRGWHRTAGTAAPLPAPPGRRPPGPRKQVTPV
jgi:DNA-binding response OmpR family regulator